MKRKPSLKRKNPLEWKARRLRTSFLRLGLDISKEEIKQRLIIYDLCKYCGDSDKLDISIDHDIPLARGGQNVRENLQFICLTCNRMKGTMTGEEFEGLLNYLEKQSDEMQKAVKTKLKMAGYGFSH